MEYLSYEIASHCFRLAQANAPFDTGNLRYNAMYLVMKLDGFEIVYDDRFADYIDYLEISGLGSSNKHVNFISNKTFWVIVEYLEYVLKGIGRNVFKHELTLPELDKLIYGDLMKTNPEAREELRTQSIASYQSKYGVMSV